MVMLSTPCYKYWKQIVHKQSKCMNNQMISLTSTRASTYNHYILSVTIYPSLPSIISWSNLSISCCSSTNLMTRSADLKHFSNSLHSYTNISLNLFFLSCSSSPIYTQYFICLLGNLLLMNIIFPNTCIPLLYFWVLSSFRFKDVSISSTTPYN